MEYHHRHNMEVQGQTQNVTGGGGGPPPPPPHWGYSNTWGAPTPTAATRASKRVHSESDCDDVFSEESTKDAQSPSNNDSCQLMTRKRRRGVIEKKRRDRINTSLTELKRLVPTAIEKQGSAKLEKAEILQLTVDHLKMLHAKGVDTLAYDPQRYAMDYHSIGFRECATEVARYLVTCEGLDIQDPLRLRLMSHLQCFAAQRELAVKSCSNPWGYPPGGQPYAPTPLNHPIPPAAPITNPVPASNLVGHLPSQHPSVAQHESLHYTDLTNSCNTSRLETNTSSTATTVGAPTSHSSSTGGYTAPQYNSAGTPGYHPIPPYHNPPPPHHQYNQNTSKPYRPWGAEVAY